MSDKVFLGIDSGTQSTKVLLVDHEGTIIGRGQSSYDLIEGLPPGHLEQHPDTWIKAMKEAITQALKNAGDRVADRVAGIGVSGQQHGFVPLDKDGKVIRAAKLWCDTSTEKQAQEIMDALGGNEAYQKATGNTLAVGFTASKILWLKQNEPDNFAKLATVLLPHDYINWWLTGDATMEFGDASGTGLLDINSRTWCEEAINAIDPKVKDCLPSLNHSSKSAGRLQSSAAKALGLPEGIIVSAGGGDNMIGAIGTGNIAPGIVTASLGTSGTIYAYRDKPLSDPGGAIAGFCDSTGGWLPLLCTMNVTVATELVKELFGIDTKQLNEAAASVPIGADGLLLLPYFNGERVPPLPNAKGVWFGATSKNSTNEHFARAAMEGASLGLGYGLNIMRELGINPKEIRLTGGASQSALWRQILADVFNCPVVCTK